MTITGWFVTWIAVSYRVIRSKLVILKRAEIRGKLISTKNPLAIGILAISHIKNYRSMDGLYCQKTDCNLADNFWAESNLANSILAESF